MGGRVGVTEEESQVTRGSSAAEADRPHLRVTLLIPILNERDGLEAILPQIDPHWLDDILFVDGGSTDGSLEVIRRWGHGRLVIQKLPGLPNAYWESIPLISSDIVVTFSPDGNSLPEAIPALIEKVREGFDMVIASRYLPGAGSLDDGPVTAFGNWMFTRLINYLFGGRYTDSLVILRAYRMDLIRALEMKAEEALDFEPLLSIRCAVYGKRVTAIPAKEGRRIGGNRKMSIFSNGWAVVVLIAREWVRMRRLKKAAFSLDKR